MTLQIWLSWLGDEWGEFKAQKLKLSSVMLLMPNISTQLHWHQNPQDPTIFKHKLSLNVAVSSSHLKILDVPRSSRQPYHAAIEARITSWVDSHGALLAVLTSGVLASGIEQYCSKAWVGIYFLVYFLIYWNNLFNGTNFKKYTNWSKYTFSFWYIFWCLFFFQAVSCPPKCPPLYFICIAEVWYLHLLPRLVIACVWGAMYPACRHLQGLRIECFRFLADG